MFSVRAPVGRTCVPAALILIMTAVTLSVPAPRVAHAATLPEGPRVQHFRCVGIGSATTAGSAYAVVNLAGGSNISLDRCWIHGTRTNSISHGVSVDGAYLAVVDSSITDIHSTSGDAQAIMGYTGSGPFKIVNNHLEASGE